MRNKVVYLLRKVTIPIISLTIFLNDILVILVIQYSSLHFISVNRETLQRILDMTKRSFLDILVTILEIIAPSHVRITTENDSVPRNTFRVNPKTNVIESSLDPCTISICNHQIYTDWIFLWWIAYTAKLGGRVHIMLKKSLESVPLLGYGMKNFKFIFMNRKWIHDRATLSSRLGELDADARHQGPLSGKEPASIDEDGCNQWPITTESLNSTSWPYNLILFPEGTNFTDNTKGKSKAYGAKVGKATFDHVLLPHTTGLRHCIKSLQPSLNVVYDITIGYSGVRSGEYAESLYGLKSIFLESKYPKLVDIHIRGFKVEEIPVDDEEAFNEWLYNVWREKDELLDRYYKIGTFNHDKDLQHTIIGDFKIHRTEACLALLCPIVTTILFLKYVISFFLG
ncbi:similar to Saccharomyces cerevisiae YDR018C Probable membrane protein with three predicted transmembrane domains [Maudiozyma saulgeensis]|uniref:Similar to Saccharomyces cerevisiae YDR018C Probable membrane protein with three predicted transmembrane domains n=1 Tax=Maudiozyma saulgeensis TaxID=1789683 RepID=A0A1X7R6Z1_9SACH|nr:similar to Saccharomyces cerevisiae YDR018C Probable membrane protein with three predicted transmembrane domains [Kazachstania saulgeensis]